MSRWTRCRYCGELVIPETQPMFWTQPDHAECVPPEKELTDDLV